MGECDGVQGAFYRPGEETIGMGVASMVADGFGS
jgi:hypothetical protein